MKYKIKVILNLTLKMQSDRLPLAAGLPINELNRRCDMSGILTFRDEFTINELHENANSLKDAFIRWDDVTVDIADVKRIDIAAIQMLIAARKEWHANGKNLIFKTSDEVADMLSIAGIQL